ncbi:MAG: LamG domain-containing protein [Planctomycetota bacterium]
MRSLCPAAIAALAAVSPLAAQNVGLQLTNGVDTYVDVPYAATLVPRSGITIEAWVTYDDSTLGTGYRWPTVVRQNSTPGSENYMLRVNAANTNTLSLGWMVRTSSGTRTASWAFTTGQLQTWTHVAGTYDGAMVRLFVNGVEVASTPATGDIVNTGNTLRIGNGDLSSPGIEEWNGEIDEVRLWPFARTAAEISDTMNFELSSIPFEVSTWNLNSNAQDSSGANAGQLVNAPTFAPNTLNLPPVTLASANFGTATTGCTGAPRSVVTTFPRVGNAAFAVGSIRSTTTGAGVFWLATANLSAPIRFLGVDLWIDPTALGVQIPVAGGALAFARIPLPIPNSPSLRNRQLVFQTIWAESGCATPLFASDGGVFQIAP